jgi:hypothetical protein
MTAVVALAGKPAPGSEFPAVIVLASRGSSRKTRADDRAAVEIDLSDDDLRRRAA